MRLGRNGWMRKKDEKKKLKWKDDKKEGLVGFFFGYNYNSPQQIKNKIYHNSCGGNVKRKLSLSIKY